MEHGPGRGAVVDLPAAVRRGTGRGPRWSAETGDLDVNLLVFGADEGVAEHVNSEVDVLLVGVAGEGTVEVEGVAHAVGAGTAVLIPKGLRRAIRGAGADFAYLTCHRRRAPLRPAPAVSPGIRRSR
jgi:mannose-6-phosphate isomerase-like protein (cupin superfamily)